MKSKCNDDLFASIIKFSLSISTHKTDEARMNEKLTPIFQNVTQILLLVVCKLNYFSGTDIKISSITVSIFASCDLFIIHNFHGEIKKLHQFF